jgi:hypothetical protein
MEHLLSNNQKIGSVKDLIACYETLKLLTTERSEHDLFTLLFDHMPFDFMKRS